LRPRSPALLAFLASAALLATSTRAEAHRFEHPRQLRVGITKERIVVSMIYDLDPGERSRTARQLFDRNTDGQVEPDEQKLLEAWMERTALRFFSISLAVSGGEAAPLPLETVRREGHRTELPSRASESLGSSLLLSAPLPPEASGWILEIKDQDVDASKHVPLVLDLAPGVSLRYASQGEWHPTARQLHRVALGKEQHLRLELGLVALP
jgi:hypothetical protein